MTTELEKPDIAFICHLPWGTHFCHFCKFKEDLLDILIPHFKTGLENNEFCLWVIPDPLDEEEASKSGLKKAGEISFWRSGIMAEELWKKKKPVPGLWG